MGEITLLRDLSVVMVAAAAMTLLCHWLRQPVVIGYLLAGLLVGPHTPPFSLVNDLHSIHTMAELGLVFLMFAMGLEFNLPKLHRVGVSATLAALLEVVGIAVIGYALGRAFHWSRLDSIYLAAILSISSTTIIAKVFSDLRLLHERFTQMVFGILILEDIVAVIILTILSGLGTSRTLQGDVALRAFGEVFVFVILFLVIGLALVPRFIHAVARLRSKETLGIVVLGLCLASALLANALGFSVALGAFLMGSIIGISHEIESIEEWIHPVRDMFSAIFFVSAGLLIDPKILWTFKGPILIVTAVTILGKTFSGALGSFLVGYDTKTSFRVGMSLAQIGEFSFVFAGLALKQQGASDFLFPLAVTVSGLTTLTTPYMIRYSDRILESTTRLVGPETMNVFDRYHRWLNRLGTGSAEGGGFLSRYLVRLIVYSVLLLAGSFLVLFVSRGIYNPVHQALLWIAGTFICLPLIRAVTNYLSHFVLLIFTEAVVRFRMSDLLGRLSIHRLYGGIEAFLMSALVVSFAWRAVPAFENRSLLLLGGGVIVTGTLLMRRWTNVVYGWLEKLMDEILGLATSEPLRQAALKADDKAGFFGESIERILIGRRDPASHESIRSLGLREKSGASIVAVYRRGKLITNPSAEMALLPNDILVLIGNPAERALARRLLTR